MRLSPTSGKGLMGQGSGNISIDGVIPASLAGYTGGGWGWLGDDICGGQAFTGGLWHLKQLVVSTDTLTDLVATTSATDLAQQFRAGNGEWARFVAGGGIHTSTGLGLTLPLAALGDMDSTGRLAVIQNYAADNGIVTYAANGSTLQTISTTVLAGTQRMRTNDGAVAYQETNTHWHLRDISTGSLLPFAPRTGATVVTIVPVSISGTLWVVELSTVDLTIRPATSSNGYVIETSPNIFFPDAVSLSAGTVRIGWSVTTGEGRFNMRIADLVTTDGGVSNGTTASGALVITPGSPISPSAMPVGPVESGGSSLGRLQPRHALKADSFVGGARGMATYQRWWEQVADQAFNLSQATGTVSLAQGGTGTTTGLSVLNGGNVLTDTTQLDTAQAFGPYVLNTGRNLVLASPLVIADYVQLNGTAQLRVV
jgi:hypothetical protein